MQTGQVDEGTASIALRKPSATICLLVTPIADYALFATVTTVAQAGGLAVWWTFPGRANPGLGGSIVANVLLFALAELKGIANPLTLIGPVPWRSQWRLLLIPVAVTAVFALITSVPEVIPTGWLFYLVTVPLAVLLFALAWRRAGRERRVSLRLS